MLQLVDYDTFDKLQRMLGANKFCGAKTKAQLDAMDAEASDYSLTTPLFC